MGLGEETFEAFHASLRRCQASPDFIARFYDKFVSAHPAVAAKFAGVDMRKQAVVLHASLHMVALASHGNETAELYLSAVAKKHSRAELDIPSELYDLWLESLMKAVADSDPHFSAAIERAWREILASGIAFMRSRYAPADPA